MFADVSLARRPDLFGQIARLDPGALAPVTPAVFGDANGWLVSDMGVALKLVSRDVGRKSRPADQQARLGGVGAAQGHRVVSTKADLLRALNALCRDSRVLASHVNGALADVVWERSTGPLTEGLTAATITLATSAPPGSLSRAIVRQAVSQAWVVIEQPDSAHNGDALLELLLSHLNSGSAILRSLAPTGWTRERIAEEMRAMLLAGWGSTSAVALSSVSLGVHRRLTDKATFDEVLRLYPPGFMIARTVERPATDLPFIEGDLVVVCPWLIHRNPRGWEDPLAFNPARWAHPPSRPWHMPFGVGPRRCPAQQLARAQARAAVAMIPEVSEPADGHVVAMVEGRSPALIPMGWTVERIYRP